MKKLIALSILLLTTANSFAHYLWIETAQTGKIGEEQVVKVHLGEYTYGVVEEVESEAFQGVNKFTLWAVSPSGEKIALKTTAQKDHYKAVFTPKENGTYTLLLNNDQIDVIDYTQYDFGIFKTHYHAVANVSVGGQQNDTATQNENGITVKRIANQDDQVKLQLLFKGQPLAKSEVKLYVKDLWSKTLETDENGYIDFGLPWDTKYILEATHQEEVPGTYNGDDYEFVWHCVTYCIPA